MSLDPDRSGLMSNPSIVKVLGDGTALPFAAQTFDLVFSEYVFEHLDQPWEVLMELDRVLRPEGSVVILVPNRLHYYAWVARFTPLWFHKAYLRLQGHQSADIDTHPTAYRWGSLRDICATTTKVAGWTLVALDSTPGPTDYTKWLPVHFLFVLIDRVLSRFKAMHMAYLAHYQKKADAIGRRERTGRDTA